MSVYFKCAQRGEPNFVIELHDQKLIEHARLIVSGSEKTRIHIQGTIVKEPRDYNAPWNWHLNPDTIGFFEVAMEVCDAAVSLVEKDLEKVGTDFLPNSWWCPWSSTVIEEIEF